MNYSKAMKTLLNKVITIVKKFKIGQPVMVKNHTGHTFEPKYLLDYKVLIILNDCILLIITPNGKEGKMNISDVIPCRTTDLIKSAYELFLCTMQTK